MGLIAELGRLAIGAWSPGGLGGGYIAAATYGAPDTSIGSDPRLELVNVDIARSKLTITANIPSSERFSSIDWSIGSAQHPAGLIAGGLSDGTVRVWEAASLLRSSQPSDPDRAVFFTSSSKKHAGAVRALEFNPFVNTRLATGGSDGLVLTWDLSNPTAGVNVSHPAGKSPSTTGAPRDEITAVAWNRKFPHILGSSTNGGVMSVWDLRQRKEVISIRNPRGRISCTSLTWHPEIATQVVVTCDEESTGALMWDLRNASAPIKKFNHHSPMGVASSSWSTFDTDLLLTSSRDSRTVVVSVTTGEIVSEAPKSASWNFGVSWSPRLPGLFLSSSLDGRLAVNSMLTATTIPSVSSETASALAESFGEMASDFHAGIGNQPSRPNETQKVLYNVSRPPQWLRRPSGVSFGFGGVRASLSSKDGNSSVSVEYREEAVPGLPEDYAKLDHTLLDVTSEDPSPALKCCTEASAAAETPKERMVWEVMSMMLQTDTRRKLLSFLGFEAPPPDAGDDIAMPVYGLARSPPLAVPVRQAPAPVEDMPGIKSTDTADQVQAITNGAGGMSLEGPAPWEIGDGAETHDNLHGSILDGDDAGNGNEENISSKQNGGTAPATMNGSTKMSLAEMSTGDVEELIKRAVIVGDFSFAVEACLQIGRTADALIIAHAGGPALWQETETQYLSKESLSEGAGIIGAIAGPKIRMEDYIRQSTESNDDRWKEALAVILTYTAPEELPQACTALGDRLIVKKQLHTALICFICAGNTELAASTWMRERLPTSTVTSAMIADRTERLVAVKDKIRLLTAALLLAQGEREIGTVRALDPISGAVLCEFGALLAISGDLSTAITYLGNLDPGYTCTYGSAEQLLSKASETLAIADSAAIPASQTMSGPGYDNFGNTAFSQATTYDHAEQSYNQLSHNVYGGAPQPSPAMWTPSATPAMPAPAMPAQAIPAPAMPTPAMPTPSMPAIPAPYTATMGSAKGFASPPRPALPTPTQVSPGPVQTSYSSYSGSAERTANDPSAVYAAAPTYNSGSYSATLMPQVPTANLSAAAPSPHQFSASLPPIVPPPPSATTNLPPLQPSQTGYGVNSTMPQSMSGGLGMAPQTLMPQPPPPPPTDADAPPPTPYHANARPGSGATLPPSAEVAVAETRRSKPISSSGTPGGPPRRTNSTSSSLSALGIETVLLEKADTSKVPPNQQVIVKSLRGSYMYARSRSDAPRYKKKMDDVSKRLGKLVAALNNGLLEAPVVDLLINFGQVVENGSYNEASVVVSKLTKQHWDSNSQWIQGLKRLIDCVLTGR